MAKGNRRLTTSRSERLLGSYAGGYSSNGGQGHEPELREEDVWSTFHDDDGGGRYGGDHISSSNGSLSDWSSRAGFESNGVSTRRGGPRRGGGGGGGLSLAFEDSSATNSSPSLEKIQAATAAGSRIVHQFHSHERSGAPRHVASSAPVNVPDWSKILRIDSVESLQEMGSGGGGGGGFGDHDDDDSSDEMVPPHEYLAREYARGRKTGGASVFEGVGRTLKGRDLRRVRDAVWSQTGFDG